MLENATPSPIALYIHWPFCKSKCPYCDFNSHVRERVPEQAYAQALIAELEHMAARVPGRALSSIFFGGGTPSLMSPDTVGALIDRAKSLFHVADMSAIEITLEANPTSVEAEKFAGFKAAGVNRVSLGVQSLRAESLKFLGREHSAGEALKAVELAATIFPRFSFDLIYALPDQTVEAWKNELQEALKYVQSHMSLYQLTIEENTAFHHAYHQKKAFALPVDNLAATLYEVTQEVMEAHGLPAYEISNHAKHGEESRHNLAYWLGHEYIGIGSGAHGRLQYMDMGNGQIEARRPSSLERASCDFQQKITEARNNSWHATACIKSPERWLEAVQTHGHGLEINDGLSARERLEEHLMMRLRLYSPLPRAELPIASDHPVLTMLVREGLAEVNDVYFSLTRRGLLIQQAIVGELIGAL